jgi:hypothetical protein
MIATNPDDPTAREFPSEPTANAGKAAGGYSLVKGLMVGLVIALVISVLVAVVRHRAAPQPLTQEAYEAAVRRWEQYGPPNYDLDLELTEKRVGAVHVEVRDGEVVRMTRDGVQPSQKRTWDVWSVPGQLETIGQELEMAQRPAESFGVRGATQVVMWADFDARYGYPRQYDRVVLGADVEVHWKITRFDVISPKN